MGNNAPYGRDIATGDLGGGRYIRTLSAAGAISWVYAGRVGEAGRRRRRRATLCRRLAYGGGITPVGEGGIWRREEHSGTGGGGGGV